MLSYIIDGPRDRQTDNKETDREKQTDIPKEKLTKLRGTERQRDRSPHQWLELRTGLSFWAMWYNALMAFMLNSGGFLSATHTHSISLLRSIPLVLAHLALCS